jgi:hypothetical protein
MSNLVVRASTPDRLTIYSELPTNCRNIGDSLVGLRISPHRFKTLAQRSPPAGKVRLGEFADIPDRVKAKGKKKSGALRLRLHHFFRERMD